MTVSTAEMNLIPLAKNVMPQLMSLHEGEEVTNGLTPSYSICCTVYSIYVLNTGRTKKNPEIW